MEFHWTSLLVMAFLYVVSTVGSLGDFSGILAAAGRELTNKELRGGLVAHRVVSAVAALLGALANTSYFQNVGLLNFTGVVSRHVTVIKAKKARARRRSFWAVPLYGVGFGWNYQRKLEQIEQEPSLLGCSRTHADTTTAEDVMVTLRCKR